MPILVYLQKYNIVSQLDRRYAQLRNNEEPIGERMIFSDLTKAIKDAKAISEVSRSVSKNWYGRQNFHSRKRPAYRRRHYPTKKSKFQAQKK